MSNATQSPPQQELFAIASPCIQVCEMDARGYCKGCLRNRTERQLWQQMSDTQKRQLLRVLWLRRRRLTRTTSLTATEDSLTDLTLHQNSLF